MMRNIFYNTSSFKFFRRQVKPNEMEKEFISLIYSKDKNKNILSEKNNINYNSKIYPLDIKKSGNISTKDRNINLDFFYQKHSLDLINKIRDLFIEFDEDRSNTFDQNEFYQMFNINKIPIKMEEIIYLFKFTKNKKVISFSELIHLTFDPDFDKRYKEIIEKIKPRCEIGIICPMDFSGMLSHLCEFGKLSPDAKKFHKKAKGKFNFPNFLTLNNNSYNPRRRISEQFDKENNVINNNVKSLRLSLKDIDLQKRASSIKRLSVKINKNLNDSTYEADFFNRVNELKKENQNMSNTLKTIIEITNKKVLRYEKLFKNTNYKNNIEKSKKRLANSMDIVHKINPEISKDYISFCPLKEEFINVKTGNTFDFNLIKDYKNRKCFNNKIKNNTINFNNTSFKNTFNQINKNKKKEYNSLYKKKFIREKIIKKEGNLLSFLKNE